MTADGGARK